jgi:hypothetical protein
VPPFFGLADCEQNAAAFESKAGAEVVLERSTVLYSIRFGDGGATLCDRRVGDWVAGYGSKQATLTAASVIVFAECCSCRLCSNAFFDRVTGKREGNPCGPTRLCTSCSFPRRAMRSSSRSISLR